MAEETPLEPTAPDSAATDLQETPTVTDAGPRTEPSAAPTAQETSSDGRPAPEAESRVQGNSTYTPAPAIYTSTYTTAEVAEHLNVSRETLQRLCKRFARYLGPTVDEPSPRFSNADITALVTVQRLLAQGYDDEQIDHHLTPLHLAPLATAEPGSAEPESGELVPFEPPDTPLEPAVAHLFDDALAVLAGHQQALVNGQAALREVLNVVVQDNFNLKDENRKLRERMLELERALAEYQRREETRKERLEGRVRALEAMVGALQQQVAQLVQIQRQLQQRRGWFG
jgi:flagellar capping protein FliD